MNTSSGGSGRVAGKVALVVGGGSGIGRATAEVLAREGAIVAVADANADAARVTANSVESPLAYALDVTREDDWSNATDAIVRAQGRLDILVNSAGITFVKPVEETTLQEWRRVLSVNLDGVFLGLRSAIRAMRASGTGGSIVNVSSASGVKPAPGATAYSTAKAGVIMLSQTAALECAARGDGIRVNAICPGGVDTPLWDTTQFFQDLIRQHGGREAAVRAVGQSVPLKRLAHPSEIAAAILYLASDDSTFVTGSVFVIDGGSSIA
jgi:NAD(P)-dependent dehydrogenase (short-subunit alcohol dehydrogenase family)